MGKRRKKTQTEKQQQIYIGKIYIIKQGARGHLYMRKYWTSNTKIKLEDVKQEVWTVLSILYNLLS